MSQHLTLKKVRENLDPNEQSLFDRFLVSARAHSAEATYPAPRRRGEIDAALLTAPVTVTQGEAMESESPNIAEPPEKESVNMSTSDTVPTTSATNPTTWLGGWTLDSLAPDQFTITASFAGGKISGTSAVNTYGGSYTSGANGAFSVGQLASTEMAGPEPAMRAEHAYITLLTQARSCKLAGDTLTLFDGNGNESLTFARATL